MRAATTIVGTLGMCFVLEACHDSDDFDEVSANRSHIESVEVEDSADVDESVDKGEEIVACVIEDLPPSLEIAFGSLSQVLTAGDNLRIPITVRHRVGGQLGVRLDIRSVGEPRRTVEHSASMASGSEFIEIDVPVGSLGLSSKEKPVSSKIGVTLRPSFADGRVEDLPEVPLYFHAWGGEWIFYSEDVRAAEYADGALTLEERERREEALAHADVGDSNYAFGTANVTRMSDDPGHVPDSEGDMR